MGCTTRTRKADSQIALLDEQSNGTAGIDIIAGRNNNYSLEFNPDGSESFGYGEMRALGFTHNEAIIERASYYSDSFVKETKSRWFDNFEDEPSVTLMPKYDYSNLGYVLDLDKTIDRVRQTDTNIVQVGMTTTPRIASEGSYFNKHREYRSAVDLTNNIILKYINKVVAARDLLAEDDEFRTEADFRKLGLSLQERDIKIVVVAELNDLLAYYDSVEMGEGDFINTIVNDIIDNKDEDNVYDTAKRELETTIRLELANTLEGEEALNEDQDTDGATGTFMKLLFDKHDGKHSTKNTINNRVKNLLMTLEDIVYDTNGNVAIRYNDYTGLPESANYNTVLNLLRDRFSNIVETNRTTSPDANKLISVLTEEQILSVLDQMSKTHPVIAPLYEEVKKNKELWINTLLYSFRTSQKQGVVTIIHSEVDNKIDYELRLINTSTRFSIGNEFAETIRTNIGNSKYTAADIQAMRELLDEKTIIGHSKVFGLLGIPFKAYQLELMDKHNLSSYLDINTSLHSLLDIIDNYIVILDEKKEEFLKEEKEGFATTMADMLDKRELRDVLSVDLENRGKVLGILTNIALAYSDFEMAGFEAQYLNANGEAEFNINDPGYVTELISFFNDSSSYDETADGKGAVVMDAHKEFIGNLIKDGRFRYSYWLPSIDEMYTGLEKLDRINNTNSFNQDGTIKESVLNETDDLYYKVLENLRSIVVDDDAGVKNMSDGVKGKVQETNYNQFKKSLALIYLGKVKVLSERDKSFVRTPSIMLADSSQFLTFQQNIIPVFKDGRSAINVHNSSLIKDKEGYFTFKDNERGRQLRRILRNTFVSQELKRMLSDMEVVFDYDEVNNVHTVKDKYQKNPRLLLANEHLGYDSNKKATVILNDKGRAVGRSFSFNTIPALNSVFVSAELFNQTTGLLQPALIQSLLRDLNSSDNNTKSKSNAMLLDEIDAAITEYVSDEVDDLNNILKDSKDSLAVAARNSKMYPNAKNDKLYKNFLLDFAINSMVSNTEQMLLIQGTASAHKNAIDVNKRAKKVASPGRAGGIHGLSEDINMMIIDDVVLKSQYINNMGKFIDGVKNNKKGVFTPAEIKKLEDLYNNIEIADGQGYITVDGYAKMLKSWGKFNEAKQYFKRVKGKYYLKDNIPQAELVQLLRTVKPYYANTIYIEELNKHTSIQVKDSLAILIPEFIQGTDLELLNNRMYSQNIEHAVMATAVKNGLHNVNVITDKNGKIDHKSLSNIDIVKLKRNMFRNQVDTVDHHMDSNIKAGIQIFKLMLADIKDTTKFEYKNADGKNMTGKELKSEFHKIIGKVLVKNSDEVVKRMSTMYNDYGKIEAKDLRQMLLDLGGKLLNEADKKLLDLNDEGTNFKIPLDVIGKQRFESLLNAVFTKNVTDLKVPGMHNIYMSNGMMKANGVSDIAMEDNEAINFADDKLDKTTRELAVYYDKVLKKWVYEAYVAPWSKDFFNDDGTLKDINDLSIDLRTMLGYRIPTSARHSAFTIKVVGFTPNLMGSVVVLPHDIVARTGADFDIDTFYINRKPHTINKDGDVTTFDSIAYDNLTVKDFDYNSFIASRNGEITYNNYILAKYLKNNGYYDELNNLRTDYNADVQDILDKYQIEDVSEEIRKLDNITADELSMNFNEYNDLANLIKAKSESEREIIKSELEVLINEMLDYQEAWRDGSVSKSVLKVKQRENANRRAGLTADRNELNDQLRAVNKLKEDNIAKMAELKQSHIGADVSYKKVKEEFNKLYNEYKDNKKSLFETHVKDMVSQDKDAYHEPNVMMGEILEIMNTIMSNNSLMMSNTMPAMFQNSIDEAENIREKEEGIDYNPIKLSTQLLLRERGRLGKEVLGIFANQNTGLAIMQETQAKLEDVGVTIPYNITSLRTRYNKLNGSKLTDKQFAKYLTDKYGEDITDTSKNTVYITYNKVGFNTDGSFDNMLGQPIIAEFGQLVDHAPDNIKDPLSRNIHPFTTNGLLALSIGGDVTYGLRLIGQDALTKVLDNYNESINAKRAVTTAKRQYYSNILDVIYLQQQLNKSSNEDFTVDKNTLTSKISVRLMKLLNTSDMNKLNLFIEQLRESPLTDATIEQYTLPKQANGKWYIKSESIDAVNHIVYEEGEVENNEKLGDYTTRPKTYEQLDKLLTLGEVVNSANATPEQIINFAEEQIDILDRYYEFHEIGKEIGKYINVLNADKKGLGSTITENVEYIKSIVNFESDLIITSGRITNETHDNNLIASIYSSLLNNKQKSTYPILDDYLVNSNIAGLEYTKDATLLNTANGKYSAMYDTVIETLNAVANKDKNSVVSALNKSIIFNKLLEQLPSLEFRSDQILGKNSNSVETDESIVNPENTDDYQQRLSKFKKLSLANKIQLIKTYYKIGAADIHALAYLKPELSLFHISKNDFHNIAVTDITQEAELKLQVQETMLNMYNNTDAFLRDVAKDMVNYSILRNGLQGGYGTFTNMIHGDVLYTSNASDVVNVMPSKYGTNDFVNIDSYNITNLFEDGIETNINDVLNLAILNVISNQTPYVMTDDESDVTEGSKKGDLIDTEYSMWNIEPATTKSFSLNDTYNNFKDNLLNNPIRLVINPTTESSKVFKIERVKNEKTNEVTYDITNLGVTPQKIDLLLSSYNSSELKDLGQSSIQSMALNETSIEDRANMSNTKVAGILKVYTKNNKYC